MRASINGERVVTPFDPLVVVPGPTTVGRCSFTPG